MFGNDIAKRLRKLADPIPGPGLEQRILRTAPASERRLPSRLRVEPVTARPRRLWLATGALAVATVLVLGFLLLSPPAVQESVAEILAPVVRASESVAVHLVQRARTRPWEDFGFVDLEREPERIEAWVRWPRGGEDEGRIRVQSSDRVYSHDGTVTVLWMKRTNEASRWDGGRPKYEYLWPAAWLQKIVELDGGAQILEREEKSGTGILRLRWAGPDLRGLPPFFFEDFPREAEIRWDSSTGRLTGFTRWVMVDGKRELYSELESIEYLDAIDEALFATDLPAGVRLNRLPAASKEIDALAPREVAERFWDAAVRGEVETLRIFGANAGAIDWLIEQRPTEVIRIGEPFRNEAYVGVFIPYEVRYGGPGGRVLKRNLALRNDNEFGRWVYDGGL